MRALYGVTIFWSALLLLLLQPVITKAILPWFGGSAGVWAASMLFFQVLLLLGYLYAHLLYRRLPARAQILIHVALLLLSLWVLPLHPSQVWKPSGGSDPLLRILGLLLTTVGLPYLMLSATSPLLQAWFTRSFQAELPWHLYAVSNLGSLAALLCYPVLIEPALAVSGQLRSWSAGYLVFAVVCAAVAFTGWNASEVQEQVAASERHLVLLWLALATVPSVLWLAFANQMSLDIAAVPFLWILPLSLYLLSFVVTFRTESSYNPRVFRWLLPVVWIAVLAVVTLQGSIHLGWVILTYSIALFLCAVFCHGELARLRPDSRALTSFYLTLASGGALGGIFVAVAAPRIFTEYMELPIGLLACVFLALRLLYRMPQKRVVRAAAVALLAVVAVRFSSQTRPGDKISLRNFYGILQVSDAGPRQDRYRVLYNGTIEHGLEYLDGEKTHIPTTYYGPTSGIAVAVTALGSKGPLRVGVIGLGAGTMAAWARKGDYYRFYELNPAVIRVAREQFEFLKQSPGPVEVVEGDARLSLEREGPQRFDLLVVDAFSGDSIPVHLLTREAFALYFHHLAPAGVIAVHVTNKHVELAPVVKLAASDRRAHALLLSNSADNSRKIYYSSWMLVTHSDEVDAKLGWLSTPVRGRERIRLWTDDYSNLFSILK